MATYKQIQDYIKEKYGRSVKTCWIAHVKEMNGLHPKISPNRIRMDKRSNPCPDRFVIIIEEAMRSLNMIR